MRGEDENADWDAAAARRSCTTHKKSKKKDYPPRIQAGRRENRRSSYRVVIDG
jgi:hypothetical protein